MARKKRKSKSIFAEIEGTFRTKSGKKRRKVNKCRFKVKAGKKRTLCFKKMKAATKAAKSGVANGKKSVSVIGMRKGKIKALKVCMKGKSGKPVCKSKIRRRKRKSTESVSLPAIETRSPGPWVDQYIYGSK
jgi:hypothetical protein